MSRFGLGRNRTVERWLFTSEGTPRMWLQAVVGGMFLASSVGIAVHLA